MSPGTASEALGKPESGASTSGAAAGAAPPPAGRPAASAAAATKKPARDPSDSPLRALLLRRAGARPEELDELARAAAALASVPAGGPLGLRAPALPAATAAPPPVAGVVDRMLVGQTRDGLPEVRLDIGIGGWRGTEVRLVAGKHGLEATVVAASEAARRVIEAQLTDLARALEARGLHVARCHVATREADDRQRQDERQRRREREASFTAEIG